MTTWYPYTICYCCSIVTESVSPPVCEILSPKNIGVTTHVTSLITWRFDSPYAVSYIGVPLKPSPYLQPLESYATPNISGSRPWPFKVTWRHRSHDDPILNIQFPISATLEPSRYVQAFSRYLPPNISGSRPWPFGFTWRHWSCDHLMPHIAFPIGVPL